MEVKSEFYCWGLEKGEEYNVRHHLPWLKMFESFP